MKKTLFKTYLEQTGNDKPLTVAQLITILNSKDPKSVVVVTNRKDHQTCVTIKDIEYITSPYFGNDEVGSEAFGENEQGATFLNIGNT